MPNEMTPELYTQLARAHNAPIREKNKLNPSMPEFDGMVDDAPMFQYLHALKGEPQSYIPETFEDEYDLNEIYRGIANDNYDSQQPYGFDFFNQHARRLDYDAEDMYSDPNWAGPRAFHVGEAGTPYDGNVYIGNGDAIAQPGDEGFIGDVKNALVPVAKTAGSYALPMLFSMLMRGGK